MNTDPKCLCTVCSGHISFDPSDAGQTVTCPHCSMETVLYIPKPAERLPAKNAHGTEVTVRLPLPKSPMADEYYCQTCGTVAKPKKATPGSIWIEIVLWLSILIPGIVYTLWRLSKRHKVCRACQSPNVIPASSPNAQRALAEYSNQAKSISTLVASLLLCCLPALAQTGIQLRDQVRPEYRVVTNQVFNAAIATAFERVIGDCVQTWSGGAVIKQQEVTRVTAPARGNSGPASLAGSSASTAYPRTIAMVPGPVYHKLILHAPACAIGARLDIKAVRIGTTNYNGIIIPVYDCGTPYTFRATYSKRTSTNSPTR